MTLAKEGTLAPYVHNLPPGANEGASARRQRTQLALQRLCKDNVAQIAILELRDAQTGEGTGEKICLSNTHIFWDPEYDDVTTYPVVDGHCFSMVIFLLIRFFVSFSGTPT